MNGLPWATWKFWKRNRSTPKRRRIKLGIDYGVSTSKIVFRDCNPSGEESCELVLHNGCAQIPSRVCATPTALLFGHTAMPAMGSDFYESLKTRVAADVTANPAYQLGRTTKLPEGFSAAVDRLRDEKTSFMVEMAPPRRHPLTSPRLQTPVIPICGDNSAEGNWGCPLGRRGGA